MNKPKKYTLLISLIIIIYIWLLPLLSKIGFAVPNQNSVSGFISNAPATGAMASLSYVPLYLMKEYQNYIIDAYCNDTDAQIASISLTFFQFFYGLFLICTFHYTPDVVHFSVVFLFGVSFIIHSYVVVKYLQPSNVSMVILLVGCTSFLVTPFTYSNGLWLWFVECIGLTCMFLFTPVEWLLLEKDTKLDSSYIDSYYRL